VQCLLARPREQIPGLFSQSLDCWFALIRNGHKPIQINLFSGLGVRQLQARPKKVQPSRCWTRCPALIISIWLLIVALVVELSWPAAQNEFAKLQLQCVAIAHLKQLSVPWRGSCAFSPKMSCQPGDCHHGGNAHQLDRQRAPCNTNVLMKAYSEGAETRCVGNLVFHWMDADGDGAISLHEFSKGIHCCQRRFPEFTLEEAELQYIFNSADGDNSGHLSRTEFGETLQQLGLAGIGKLSVAETSTFESLKSAGAGAVPPVSKRCHGRLRQARIAGREIADLVSRRWHESKVLTKSLWQGMVQLKHQTVLACCLMHQKATQSKTLSSGQQSMVRRAQLDLIKLVPFLFICLVVPGGSALSLFLVKRFPHTVPSAFRRVAENVRMNEFDALSVRSFNALLCEGTWRTVEANHAKKLDPHVQTTRSTNAF